MYHIDGLYSVYTQTIAASSPSASKGSAAGRYSFEAEICPFLGKKLTNKLTQLHGNKKEACGAAACTKVHGI